MIKLRLFTILIGVACLSCAYAAGPAKVASIDRSLWPMQINNGKQYNEASMAEISQFAFQLDSVDLNSVKAITEFTGIEAPYKHQVDEWLKATKMRLISNYRSACTDCTDVNWSEVARPNPDWSKPSYSAWNSASQSFHKRYLYEQVRLAALFPRISSEIEKVDQTAEINGHAFEDGNFLLTYDDGPSISRTQPLISLLQEHGINATFFVLGDQLEKTQLSRDTYKGQCLASHGYSHKSHQRWDEWQSSLDKTRQLLKEYKPIEHFWFRPPYGQRHQPLVESLKESNEKVMLWNIDSQDWNRKLSNKDVENRVVTLMMLWRKGIILYHDIHPKALSNLTPIKQFSDSAGLKFTDCQTLSL